VRPRRPGRRATTVTRTPMTALASLPSGDGNIPGQEAAAGFGEPESPAVAEVDVEDIVRRSTVVDAADVEADDAPVQRAAATSGARGAAPASSCETRLIAPGSLSAPTGWWFSSKTVAVSCDPLPFAADRPRCHVRQGPCVKTRVNACLHRLLFAAVRCNDDLLDLQAVSASRNRLQLVQLDF
jgi:hypothetical protein